MKLKRSQRSGSVRGEWEGFMSGSHVSILRDTKAKMTCDLIQNGSAVMSSGFILAEQLVSRPQQEGAVIQYANIRLETIRYDTT